MKVEVGWEGMAGFRKALAGVSPEAAKGLSKAIRTGTNRARTEVRHAAPRGASIRKGVRARVTGRGIDTAGVVRLSGAAGLVARGTRPHPIVPKNARVLAFKGGGFAARAQHPGTPPDDYFDRGVQAAMPVIEAELAKVGADITRMIATKE